MVADAGSFHATIDLLLRDGLESLGLPSEVCTRILPIFSDLSLVLAEWAARMNLTGHRDPPAIVQGLILEAVALSQVMPRLDSLADIGSGAGFPGLPLAVLWPDTQLTLIEPRERRHHFQRHAVRSLGLSNLTLLHGRAEDLDPAPHQGAIAQAVGAPNEVVGWMKPWVRSGGWMMIATGPEGPFPTDPIAPGASEKRRYHRPHGDSQRVLWLGRP